MSKATGLVIGRRVGHSLRLRLRACAILLLGVWAGVSAPKAWGAQATLVADTHVNSALPAANSGAIGSIVFGAGHNCIQVTQAFSLETVNTGRGDQRT